MPEVGYFRIYEEGVFLTGDVPKMDRERRLMTKKILDLTMEIIYLLTGEKYAAVKMTFIEGLLQGMYPPVLEGWGSSQGPILEPAPHSLTSESNRDKKIIEVAQKIIDLLTGEVPIRCQDVTVYFSMEEWEYIEGHKDLYKDIMSENQPPLTSPDGSRIRKSHPLYFRDSTPVDHTIPHHYQGEDLSDGTVPCVEEERSSMAEDQRLQEALPPEISRYGHHTRRTSEEHPTCSMNGDNVIEDSQGGNLVTPNIHPGPHSADTSTDPSNSKNYFTEEAHSVLPRTHPGLQNVDSLLNPTICEEPSPMELDTVSPNILSALSRSPDLSLPNEPPDKLHTAPISPELCGSLHPTNPQESSPDVSHTLTQNIHLRLQNTDESLDLTNPEESAPHTVTSNINLGLHNMDRSPESKESSPFKSHTITSNIYLELNRSLDHPEESSAQSQTDVNKDSSLINGYTLTPKIHSGHESSLDGSPAFSLNIHPGVPSVDRSADPSNPKKSFPDKSKSVTLHMHSEPSSVHRSPTPEACHPMQPQTATANMRSECHRSLEPRCVGVCSTTSHTIQNGNSGAHNTDRSLDPEESSASSHTILQVSQRPHIAERLPDPHYLDKSFATSHSIPHVNSVPHSKDRSQGPCYSHESSATSPTIPNVNSEPHSAERLPDPSCPDESFAASPAFSNVNSGPHSKDRTPDLCYPDESSTSPTIPNVNSSVQSADNQPDPVNSWVSFLMTLHTGGSSMYSSLATSLNPSDHDDSCDKQLPVPKMNPGFCSSSITPYFTNPEESSPDKANAVTPNLQPDHYSIDRIPDLTSPGIPHTVNLDIHQELPSVDRTPNSLESSLMKSHVIIQSKLNTFLDPSCYVETSGSSQTPANSHSGFDKAARSTDYFDLGVSSLLKSRTVSSNTQAMINGSLDPSYPVEPSEISHTALNNEEGLHSTSRSLHPLNPNESSLDISHTQNIHLVHHYADRPLDHTNPEESSAEKPHTDTPDIHHSVSRTSDPEVSYPMQLHNITSNIYSEFNSPDPSFCDKSSVGLHTAPNIHSGLQTADSSEDQPIDYLLSNKLLITLNVNPELHLLDKSSMPSYPEEYSSMKSLIISPNIRSLRGRSPDPSPDESSEKSHTTLNLSLGIQSPDRSLHTCYPEECPLDKFNAATPKIDSGHHSLVTTLDPEVSSHIKSQTVTPNINSFNRSPDLYYPDESTAKSHLSHPGHHSQNRSPEPSKAEQSPPNVSLSVDSNVLLEHDSVNRSPELSIAEQSPPNVLLSVDSNVLPEHESVNRSPELSTAEQSPPNVSLSVDSNVLLEHDSVNRSPELSIAEQSPPNVLLSVDSNVLPEHDSVNRSPELSTAEQSPPNVSLSVDSNVLLQHDSVNRSPELSIAEQSPPNALLSVDSNVLPEHDSVNRSQELSTAEQSTPIVSLSVDSNVLLEHDSVNRSPELSIAEQSPPNVSLSVDSNVLLEHDSVNRSPELSIAEQSPPNVLLSVDSNVLPEHDSVNRSPELSTAEQSPPNVSLSVDSNVLPEHQSVNRSPNKFSPNISSLNRSSDSYYPDESIAKSHSSPNIHAGHHSENRSPDPSIAQQSPPNVSLSVDSNILPEHQSVNRSPNQSHPTEVFSMKSHSDSPNICSLTRSPNSHYPDESSAKSHSSLNIHAENHSENRSLDPSIAEQSPPNVSLIVDSNVLPEPHSVDRSPNFSHLKELFSMESHTVIPIVGSAFKSTDRSPGHSNSIDASQTVTLNHSYSFLDPIYNPEESSPIKPHTLCPNSPPELERVDRSLDNEVSFSQSVTQDADLERHNVDSPPSLSNPKESGSTESPPITTDILQELCNAHRCLDSSGLHESFQALNLNIYYEPHSAHNLADPCDPEELPHDGSLAIMPTNHPEICSLDRSPKSSEGSLEKSYYVLPNISLEPHKADRSTDTSNLQETSFEQTHTVTQNIDLALHQTMDASKSKKRSQNKSRARNLNPSNPKQALPKRSGCAAGKTDQNGLTEFSCSVCGRCFRRESIFLKHWGIYCGKISREKPRLKQPHKKKSEKKSSPPAKRGELFKKKAVVLKEPNTQQSKGPYPCPECGKFYSQKSNLLQHRRIHTGVKPFSCLHCGKSFTKKISLVTHIRIHSGEKPFTCKQCGKCFGQQAHLDRHRKMHTGEKPYPCPECDKSFLQKCDLVKHRRIHQGLRPYLCTECGKSFTETSGLKRHRRLHR